MDRDTTVDLDEVHDAILATVRDAYPGLVTVDAYPEDRRALKADKLPAFFLEMAEFEPGDMDPGTGQQAVNVKFEALLVVGALQPGFNPKREVRRLAASFAAFVRLKRWGLPVGPARFLAAVPDDFNPDLDQFEVWRVDWEQVVHLGETVWNVEAHVPLQIMLGQAPLIGPGHEPDYVQVHP